MLSICYRLLSQNNPNFIRVRAMFSVAWNVEKNENWYIKFWKSCIINADILGQIIKHCKQQQQKCWEGIGLKKIGPEMAMWQFATIVISNRCCVVEGLGFFDTTLCLTKVSPCQKGS